MHNVELRVCVLTMYCWGDRIIVVKREEERTGLRWRNPKKRGRLKDLGVNSIIIAKQILKGLN